MGRSLFCSVTNRFHNGYIFTIRVTIVSYDSGLGIAISIYGFGIFDFKKKIKTQA